MTQQAYLDGSKLLEKLSEADWSEGSPHLAIEERVWYSDIGKLYLEDSTARDVDYDRSLKYLEGRFNPETVATGKSVGELVDEILGN
jgi:hypothetical protein